LTASKIAEEAGFIHAGARRSRKKYAQKSKSKSALTNMLDLAMPLLDVKDAKLDAAPDLLTVKNGTLDLTTGRLEPHDPRDLITKMVDVSFDPKAEAPAFQAYMKMASGGDPDLLEFLQRSAGYSLTGHTDEQAFFFVHGPGKSGKTTLLNVLLVLLGELACHTPTETLMVRNFDNNIPADLARLKGMRLTTASEANHNKQLDEAKIKAMTGGDPITARHLHKEWFEFIPTFKLWMAANDFPRVRATDGAMWRRIKAIPFRNEIPEAERDKKLPAKLKSELPGILAWAVRGAVLWHKEGLGTCAAVERTVSEWRKGSDLASRFFAECCARADGATVGAKTMHERYVAWCKANGEKHESDAKLKGQLIELDLAHARIKAGSVWKNVRLVK
jgi:putative DNA primase/helicase